MLAATPGSLQYLKQYGFETFHGLIDESYDTILDPRERLKTIVQDKFMSANTERMIKNFTEKLL